jgi:hypothetical protein
MRGVHDSVKRKWPCARGIVVLLVGGVRPIGLHCVCVNGGGGQVVRVRVVTAIESIVRPLHLHVSLLSGQRSYPVVEVTNAHVQGCIVMLLVGVVTQPSRSHGYGNPGCPPAPRSAVQPRRAYIYSLPCWSGSQWPDHSSSVMLFVCSAVIALPPPPPLLGAPKGGGGASGLLMWQFSWGCQLTASGGLVS